jgi:hypothetical protein
MLSLIAHASLDIRSATIRHQHCPGELSEIVYGTITRGALCYAIAWPHEWKERTAADPHFGKLTQENTRVAEGAADGVRRVRDDFSPTLERNFGEVIAPLLGNPAATAEQPAWEGCSRSVERIHELALHPRAGLDQLAEDHHLGRAAGGLG